MHASKSVVDSKCDSGRIRITKDLKSACLTFLTLHCWHPISAVSLFNSMTQFITYATSSDLWKHPLTVCLSIAGVYSWSPQEEPRHMTTSLVQVCGWTSCISGSSRHSPSLIRSPQSRFVAVHYSARLRGPADPCKASPGHCPPSSCRPLSMLPGDSCHNIHQQLREMCHSPLPCWYISMEVDDFLHLMGISDVCELVACPTYYSIICMMQYTLNTFKTALTFAHLNIKWCCKYSQPHSTSFFQISIHLIIL